MKKFKISYDLLKGGTAFLTSLENDLEFKLDDTHIENLLDEDIEIDEKYNLIKNIFKNKLIYNLYVNFFLDEDEIEKFKELLNNFTNDKKNELIKYLVMDGDYKNNELDPIDFQKAYLKYGHDINSDLSLQTQTQKHLEEFIFNETKIGSWYFKKLADMIERIRYIYELENELVVILLKDNELDNTLLNSLIKESKKKKNIFSYIYLSSLNQTFSLDYKFIFNYYFPNKIYDDNNFDELVEKLIKHKELNTITINLIEEFITSDIKKSQRLIMRSADFIIICLKNAIQYKNIDLLNYLMQKNIPLKDNRLIIESLKNGNDTITLELIKKYISENNENFNENIVEKFKNGNVTELKNIVKETNLPNDNLLSETNTIDNAKLLIDLELYKNDDLINALHKSIKKKNVELTEYFVNKVDIEDLFIEKGTFNETAFDLASSIFGKNDKIIIFTILYNKIKSNSEKLEELKEKSRSNEVIFNLIKDVEKNLKID